MKRHERPYGCTFLNCNKEFGSKNDWKRHENSQHFHLETWRCDISRADEKSECAKVCYRRQTFQDHLKKEHALADPEAVKKKLDSCRMGRNCQSRFWCGFCASLVDLKKKGLEAWGERFDHIDDHFMGRKGLEKQGIQDWVPLDGKEPKGEFEGPHPLGGSPNKADIDDCGSPSRNSHSPESSGQSSARAIVLEGTAAQLKRSQDNTDEDDSRPKKQAKTSKQYERRVYCVSFTEHTSLLVATQIRH